jgi:hypothetical protein
MLSICITLAFEYEILILALLQLLLSSPLSSLVLLSSIIDLAPTSSLFSFLLYLDVERTKLLANRFDFLFNLSKAVSLSQKSLVGLVI